MVMGSQRLKTIFMLLGSCLVLNSLVACKFSSGVAGPDDGYYQRDSDQSDSCFISCDDYSSGRDSDNPPRYDGRNDDRPVSDREREARDAERRGHNNVLALHNAKILANKYELPFESALKLEEIVARLDANDLSVLTEVGMDMADLKEIQQGYFPKAQHMINLANKLNLSVHKTYELINRIKTNFSRN